jgi:predicted XRE-type DNA-binding protein
MRKKSERVDAGSGDVFVDLGFSDAGERKLRVQLAMRLNNLIAEQELTQAKAAAVFGIPQPHVSELKHYKLTRFSSERLLRFLTLLDRDVDIVIRPKGKGQAAGLVSVSMDETVRARTAEMRK